MSDADCTPGREPRSVAASLHLKFQIFPGVTPQDPTGLPLREVATSSRTHPQHGRFGCSPGQARPVLETNRYAVRRSVL